MVSQKKASQKLERGADKATRWIGSTASLIFHTILFVSAFMLPLFGANLERVLLILTTAVSLEAIYLAIFIQMSVNKNSEDIEEIQEDVEEIQKDVDEIQEDVDEIQEGIEDLGDETEEEKIITEERSTLAAIQNALTQLQKEIERLKK